MKKKIDSRIQTLLENCHANHQRSMLLIVGDRARYQVLNFHYMLSRLGTGRQKPKVLWCYKHELEFSSHQKKRMKEIKNMQMKGLYDEKVDDAFELFVSSNDIRYCYYKDSHKILGNTYQMLILQDFEALTPNLLCRTMETVQGGGIIIFLLRTMTSLKQLHTLVMDVHSRYRTEAHSEVQPRFNERFLLSLSHNHNCVVMDDELNVLPISDHLNSIKPAEAGHSINKKAQQELSSLQKSLQEKEIIGKLIATTRTLDQAKVVMGLVDSLTQKTNKWTFSLTAGRGRGKSASMGLSLAAALALGYSNIFVSAPSPDNLNTFFEFVCIGLELLDFKERMDFEKVLSSSKEYSGAVMRVDVFKQHRQFVQFVFPNDAEKIGQCDLMVIDEAAAIPLPYVKQFMGSHNLIMASTINGYQGTGRSLSIKLLDELRQNSYKGANQSAAANFKKLKEMTMTDPIRYALNDPIQQWLNDLLLLNATEPVLLTGNRLPHPTQCDVYLVNRDTLFSYKTSSEKFMFRLMSLFISSHYKNSPNDLQLLSDSAAHLVFVLLPPIVKNSQGKTQLPDILCAVQVALEGNLSSSSVQGNAQRGNKPSGDLIPWNIREQFQDGHFPTLAGARIVRIATHAKAAKMGYGSRALQQLAHFFEGKLLSIDEDAEMMDYDFKGEGVRKPLLKRLEQIRPPSLHYLGTSFGFTPILLKFWRKNGFEPVYLRQTVNDITSQYSGIMLKPLENEQHKIRIEHYVSDFKKRLSTLLGFEFRKLQVKLALEILHKQRRELLTEDHEQNLMQRKSLQCFIDLNDLNRLKSYSKNQVDYHLILDLIPHIARLFFTDKLGKAVNLGYTNQAILVGLGLQMKSFEQICKQIDLQVASALPIFQKTVVKFTKIIEQSYQKDVVKEVAQPLSSEKRAVANEAATTSKFADKQTERILESGGGRGRVNYALGDDAEVPENVQEGQVVTVKRSLADARDFEGKKGRKKTKR